MNSLLAAGDGVSVDVNEVRAAAKFIEENLPNHFVAQIPLRFALEIFHRALFGPVPILSPSLEIGIGDGFSSWFMHRGKPNFDYGADMPFGATLESCGMDVAIQFDRYNRMVGMDMTQIPFPDNSFATIMSSQTMAYGQDLVTTYSEIMRVLMPGGRCTFAVDIDEWMQFPSLVRQMRVGVPSFEVHSADYHIELLRNLGAVNITARPFFTATLEAVLQSGLHMPMDKLAVIRPVLVTLIERELQRAGPSAAFNVFVSFQKPGKAERVPSVPEPVCAACKGPLTARDGLRIQCEGCTRQYWVSCGVPILVVPDHPGYSPTPYRERAERLMQLAGKIVADLLDGLSDDTYYIFNDHEVLWTGHPAPRILLGAVLSKGRSVGGILDASLRRDQAWHEIPIVHAEQIAEAPGALLGLTHAGGEQAFTQRVYASGVRGRLFIVVLEETAGNVSGRVVQATL